jgi:tRNA(Ile)-lysidine synthase
MASSRSSPSELRFRLPPGDAVCVGFSGGVDSAVLLDAMVEEGARAVSAVHVHHGLSPNAGAWADFCRDFCAARGVPLAVERVSVDRNAPEGLEAAARKLRYAVYAARPEPYVALAHHLDDQAETVLLQLLRGTGLKGIAAMPEIRALAGSATRLYRPLLAIPRAALAARAKARGLAWIDDESNDSTRHDRNYLRHDVAPLLDARFPGWRESVARFARHAGSANHLLEEIARKDGALDAGLHVDPALGAARRANALRAFLAMNALPMPSEARLEEMARQLYGARGDARVRIEHAGVAIVRRRDTVHIDAGPRAEAWRVAWRGEEELDLGPGRGQVRFERVTGRGFAAAWAGGSEWHFMPRAGGEKIRLDARRPTRTLKNLLQEHDVPEWQRDRLPLLFRGEQLAWVPGVGIAAELACEAGARGILPCWKVAGAGALC